MAEEGRWSSDAELTIRPDSVVVHAPFSQCITLRRKAQHVTYGNSLSTQEGGEEAELGHPAGTAFYWILIAMLPLGPAPEPCPFVQRSTNGPALIGASNTSFDHRVKAAAGRHGVQVSWRQV